MTFGELVRKLEQAGFSLLREKGSVRYYAKPGWDKLIRVDYHGRKEVPAGTCHAILKRPGSRTHAMLDLNYSLIIEATADPSFFSFYSPELDGFSGTGSSVEDCLYKAKWGMIEHVGLLREQGLRVPPPNPNPQVTIQNALSVV